MRAAWPETRKHSLPVHRSAQGGHSASQLATTRPRRPGPTTIIKLTRRDRATQPGPPSHSAHPSRPLGPSHPASRYSPTMVLKWQVRLLKSCRLGNTSCTKVPPSRPCTSQVPCWPKSLRSCPGPDEPHRRLDGEGYHWSWPKARLMPAIRPSSETPRRLSFRKKALDRVPREAPLHLRILRSCARSQPRVALHEWVPIALTSSTVEPALFANALSHALASAHFGDPAAQPVGMSLGNNVPEARAACGKPSTNKRHSVPSPFL